MGPTSRKGQQNLEELLATKSSIDTHRQKVVWNWVWNIIGMTPRYWSPLKKLEPSVPIQSGKLKQPALWPSGKLRPEGPSRLVTSTGDISRPSNTWRSKSSKRKARVRLTFSPPCQTALSTSPVELRGALVASYHILMGQAPTSHPFSLSQGASPAKQPSASAAPPAPVPEHSPRPKRQLPS